jgi:Ran GTPase-activating protein (RanGAP) involved in mRNA processing and transport
MDPVLQVALTSVGSSALTGVLYLVWKLLRRVRHSSCMMDIETGPSRPEGRDAAR